MVYKTEKTEKLNIFYRRTNSNCLHLFALGYSFLFDRDIFADFWVSNDQIVFATTLPQNTQAIQVAYLSNMTQIYQELLQTGRLQKLSINLGPGEVGGVFK